MGQPFKDIFDFAERVDLGKINKGKLEALVLSGAFDEFGYTRSSMMNAVQDIINYKGELKKYTSKMETYNKKILACTERLQEIEKDPANKKLKPLKQPTAPEMPVKPSAVDMPEMSNLERLRYEKELTGFYISGHPLDNYEKVIKRTGFTIGKLKDPMEGQPDHAELIGVVGEIETKETRNKQKMALTILEDKTGTIKLTMFSSIWNKVGHLLQSGSVVKVTGKVEYIDAEEDMIPSAIKVSMLEILPDVQEQVVKPIDLVIPLDLEGENPEKMDEILEKYKGRVHRVNVSYQTQDGSLLVLIPSGGQPLMIDNRIDDFKNEVYKFLNERSR